MPPVNDLHPKFLRRKKATAWHGVACGLHDNLEVWSFHLSQSASSRGLGLEVFWNRVEEENNHSTDGKSTRIWWVGWFSLISKSSNLCFQWALVGGWIFSSRSLFRIFQVQRQLQLFRQQWLARQLALVHWPSARDSADDSPSFS